MAQDALRFIDSDGHILEPPTGMQEFAPREFRDRIWHVEADSDGLEWVCYNGQRTRARGASGTAGFSREERERAWRGEIPYSKVRPAAWDPCGRAPRRGQQPPSYCEGRSGAPPDPRHEGPLAS